MLFLSLALSRERADHAVSVTISYHQFRFLIS